jgi:hypothetical protein
MLTPLEIFANDQVATSNREGIVLDVDDDSRSWIHTDETTVYRSPHLESLLIRTKGGLG